MGRQFLYHNCIFCSADLGSNDSLEGFPVGRSLAFDAAKGRLWAVCPKCARWNLAPIEERWEAIEDAERLFCDTRTRAQRENIGLARLRDGTRLIRVGEALAGEVAVWRYGESLLRRRTRALALTTLGIAGAAGVIVAGVVATGFSLGVPYLLIQGGLRVHEELAARLPVTRLSAAETGDGRPLVLRQSAIKGSALERTDDGGLRLRLAGVREVEVPWVTGILQVEPRDLVVQGAAVPRVLARIMVRVNGRGARPDTLHDAVHALADTGSARAYLMRTAGMNYRFGSAASTSQHNLALEMALHEETERQALEGELSMLEAMWREAEEIAAIADRLPDHLPPTDPPRV